jgi:hypothetical protein
MSNGINFFQNSAGNFKIPIIRDAEVVSVDDDTKSCRIKVRIDGIDNGIKKDKDLPYCVPLLPKYVCPLPKVGECVLVFQHEYENSSFGSSFKNNRFWVGPLITQPDKLDGEQYNSAKKILPGGVGRLPNPKIDIGAYDDPEDVTIQGRYNTDIIQKDRQIWIRAGKIVDGEPTKFNNKNLGYIQVKFGGKRLIRTIEEIPVEDSYTPPPETRILVVIRTYKNGVALADDLPTDSYIGPDIEQTEVFINVYDAKTSTLKSSFEDENINSRNEALDIAKQYIDSIKGSTWIIKSSAKDLISHYKGANGVAQFEGTPITVEKVIREIKFTEDTTSTSKGSVINVVADKINFISHEGEHTFNLTDPKGLITDEEQEKINNEAHPIVYGDTLVEFLELVKKYVKLHVHPYHGLPADPNTVFNDVVNFPLDTILNKNINSN